MKRLIIVSIFIATLFSISNSQEQMPVEKKAFSNQDEKLYVNKELGVYLWMSSSPDKSSKKHILLSDSSKKYTNPMFFDTEGYNTLRSPSVVDPITKKTVYPKHDIIFEVYSDSKPPVTKHKFVKGNAIYRSNKLFYGNGDVAFALSAIDYGSGVSKTFYSINEKNYLESTDTIKLNSEGETLIKYYSVDNVGNLEKPIVINITIDNTAPKTTYEIKGKKEDGVIPPTASIKLISKDDLSGVKTIYYMVNNGAKQIYNKPISAKALSSGGTLTFYAIDYLNNTEEIQKIAENE